MLKGLTSTQVLAIRPDAVQELQEPDAGTTLKHDGSNLASVIQVLESRDKEVAKRVCEILASIVPGTTGVRTVKHGKKLSLEFTQKWESGGSKKKVDFEAFLMSDGTLRALGILMAFYQVNRPRVVAIEEPEATIHPEALATILDLVRSFARDAQIIVTTHSPELLDAKWIEAENIRIVSWDAGVTQVRPLGPSSVAALKDHLMGVGELMRSNALDDSVDLFGDEQIVQMDLFGDEPA